MALLARRERLLQILRDGGDGGGADERRTDEREADRLARFDQLDGRRQPLRDEDAGDFLKLQTRDGRAPLLGRELAEEL